MSSVKGMDSVMKGFNKALNIMKRTSKQGITEVCLDLQGRSQNLAPIDTGDLRGSAEVRIDEEGGNPVGTLSYNTPYAKKMHEDMNYHPHEPGTGPKYMEIPLEENRYKYIKHIERKTKEGLR